MREPRKDGAEGNRDYSRPERVIRFDVLRIHCENSIRGMPVRPETRRIALRVSNCIVRSGTFK